MPEIPGMDYYPVVVKWRQFARALEELDTFEGTSREDAARNELHRTIEALKRCGEWPHNKNGGKNDAQQRRFERNCHKVFGMGR